MRRYRLTYNPAFDFVARACEEHDGVLVYATHYPFSGLLRADPRMDAAGACDRV
jgi:hypothetical protein